ncbi:hypothetical protein BKA61DRAFT_583844 [Leptodontidium sp. MPI-SDFR-AT-0119]|nr:hypothetical protein BKA61DRAFT_583844 [Leptodontidium sp. MPI-SDFR-AT-0119]
MHGFRHSELLSQVARSLSNEMVNTNKISAGRLAVSAELISIAFGLAGVAIAFATYWITRRMHTRIPGVCKGTDDFLSGRLLLNQYTDYIPEDLMHLSVRDRSKVHFHNFMGPRSQIKELLFSGADKIS